MGRPVHFELQVSDVAKSQKFYGDLFGWTFQQFGEFPYWLVNTGDDQQPGINGGMMPSQGLQNWVNTIAVDDIDAMMKQVVDAGGAIVVEKTAIPGMGWYCYGKDLDGNIFGMMQMDPSAA
jgi:predicted enzyme related to lactoylglutathione lyase